AIIGAECLLRWKHPGMGMISPARFIPLAERSGLIIELGEWVLEQAVAQLHAWRGTALAHIELSVNVSTVQFKRATLDAVVGRVLARHDIAPHLLKLEVTESALIHDAEKFVAMCQALRDLGVRLAIDDFGTGYSNLAYLQRFEVDDVKIDQLFIRRLMHFSQDRAIVQAIIQMAHALNVQTTAEGIEDSLTHENLTAMGCDKGQGYWFARPQELKDFEALATAQATR
ncbi:MAG: EAL domain-containing protein, partial [Paucibacter sp.]|nr:EAL domain-containing protein [Roseateles sp.]